MGKTIQDVAGHQNACFYFEPCPICYGCRCYHKYCSSKCDRNCGIDMKKNVCTSSLHYPKNFEKMIIRPSTTIATIK